jgi:hypothetical protein
MINKFHAAHGGLSNMGDAARTSAEIRRVWPDPAPGPLDDAELLAAYAAPAGPMLRVNFVTSVDGAVSIDGYSAGLGGPCATCDASTGVRPIRRWLWFHAGSAWTRPTGCSRMRLPARSS